MNRIGRLEKMLDRISVIFAFLQQDGVMKLDVIRLVRGKNGMRVEEVVQEVIAGDIGEMKLKEPILFVVAGHGIIRKVFHEEDEDGIRRVTENEDIIWERFDRDDGERVICFTRRDKIVLLEEELHGYQVPVIETCLWGVRPGEEILPANRERVCESAIGLAERFYHRGITWRDLLKGGKRGDSLAALIAGKIKLVALLCLLGLLVVNYMWNTSVREKYAGLQLEIASLERDVSNREELSREMERVVREFEGSGTGRVSVVLDRVAALVPPAVNLDMLVVNPLLKGLEEGKSVVTREGCLELSGVTADPGQVTLFTGSLSSSAFARQVKLVSLDRNRETGWFNFKIWIGL